MQIELKRINLKSPTDYSQNYYMNNSASKKNPIFSQYDKYPELYPPTVFINSPNPQNQ